MLKSVLLSKIHINFKEDKKIVMLNLEDLIEAEPESHPLCSHSSEAKQTNLPELKEF